MSPGEGSKRSALWAVGWVLLALGGGILWAQAVSGAEAARAWRALLTNFLFFTSLAGGLVVWPAVVRRCNGAWHAGIERIAAAAAAFAVPSLLAIVALWIGSAKWSPWYGRLHHQGVWLDNGFLFGRNAAALAIFWGAALWYLLLRRRGKARKEGGILVLVYALVFSLLGMDLVMALDPKWFSTLAGGYFFMSGLYIAITGWALFAAFRPEARPEQLQDLGRLVVAFSLMTTYLMYAHLLPIWYENLPHEVTFVVPRMNYAAGKEVGYLLLAVVYFGPLVLFLTERSKMNRWSLGGISLLVLLGMWLERWWLVAPTFDVAASPGVAELSAAALFTGVFGISLWLFHRLAPQRYLSGDE